MNIYMRAITSIHAGAGQDTGIVDLPIQREKITGIPKIEASSLKGCFRKLFEEREQDIIFGKTDSAGIIGLIDARLLFFPIKSARGIFALITCPFVVQRYLQETKKDKDEFRKLIEKLNEGINFVSNDTCYLVSDRLIVNNETVMLGEYIFKSKLLKFEDLEEYKKLTPYTDKIAVVSDDNFFDFVSNFTEVVTRNKIDNLTGTASDKGLFTEEYLPQESILYTIAMCFNDMNSSNNDDYLSIFARKLKNKKIQIGGNKTLGKGFVKLLLPEEAN